jgi:hypothetical protein
VLHFDAARAAPLVLRRAAAGVHQEMDGQLQRIRDQLQDIKGISKEATRISQEAKGELSSRIHSELQLERQVASANLANATEVLSASMLRIEERIRQARDRLDRREGSASTAACSARPTVRIDNRQIGSRLSQEICARSRA